MIALGSRAFQAQPSAEEIRAETDRILGQRKFGDSNNFLERGFLWVWRRIADFLFNSDPNPPDVSPITTPRADGGNWVLMIVVVVALGLLLWRLWKLMPEGGFRRLKKKDSPTVTETAEQRTRRTEWLARARQAEQVGNYSEAVHARYHATQAGLVERNELPGQPGLTSGEAVENFDASTGRRAALSDVAGQYEQVWFGGTPAEVDIVERLQALDEQVLADESEPVDDGASA